MNEANRSWFKGHYQANREAIDKAKTMIKRTDRPPQFANWTPAVNDEFDRRPVEAEYAIYLWECEAESRAYDLSPILEPRYFEGLSRTLTFYADHLALRITNSLLDFAKWSSTGQGGELRTLLHEDHSSLLSDTANDLIRLRTAIAENNQASTALEDSRMPPFPEDNPEPSEIERQIISAVRKMDAERKNGADPNSTGEGLACALDKNFNSTFKQTLAYLRRFFVLRRLPDWGYACGDLVDWYCPDSDGQSPD